MDMNTKRHDQSYGNEHLLNIYDKNKINSKHFPECFKESSTPTHPHFGDSLSYTHTHTHTHTQVLYSVVVFEYFYKMFSFQVRDPACVTDPDFWVLYLCDRMFSQFVPICRPPISTQSVKRFKQGLAILGRSRVWELTLVQHFEASENCYCALIIAFLLIHSAIMFGVTLHR